MIHYYNIRPGTKFFILLESFTSIIRITDDLVTLQFKEVFVDLMEKQFVINNEDLYYLNAPCKKINLVILYYTVFYLLLPIGMAYQVI